MALVYGAPGEARAQHPPRGVAASSSRATSSTGGTRPPGRGRPHPDLRRLPLAPVRRLPLRRRRPATRPSSTSPSPFLEGAAARARPGGRLRPARRRRARSATLYEHCVRALEHGLPARRPRPAADGHRRLERRHEPRRRRGQGRERLGRLVPDRRSSREFAALAEARGDPARAATLPRPGRGAPAPPSRSTPGTATGIAGPTSTTARRSARPQNDECRIDSLAQSWAVISGAADPERARQAMAVGRRAAGPARRRPDPPVRPRRSTRARSSPATSRATSRASARTAASTPTRPPGSSRPPRSLGRGRRAVELFDLLNPIRHADRPRGGRPLQGRALRRRGRRLRPAAAHRPGRLDLVHRLGRLALPRRPRGDPRASSRQGDRLAIDPCIPGDWPGFEIDLPPPLGDLPDRRREPRRRRARASRRHARRPARRRGRDPAGRRRPAHEVRVVLGPA